MSYCAVFFFFGNFKYAFQILYLMMGPEEGVARNGIMIRVPLD
jgi:hypothetical protein